MRMGDWIAFRGRRRFVVGVRSSGIVLARVRPSRFPSPYVFYCVSAAELTSLAVVKHSTPSARRRARRILETGLTPWTSIEWDGDVPNYVHTDVSDDGTVRRSQSSSRRGGRTPGRGSGGVRRRRPRATTRPAMIRSRGA